VLLDLCVQALTLSLHFRAFLVPLYQVRTEQIEFVIQNDELAHEFVLYSAVHQFIILFYLSLGIRSPAVGTSARPSVLEYALDTNAPGTQTQLPFKMRGGMAGATGCKIATV